MNITITKNDLTRGIPVEATKSDGVLKLASKGIDISNK